MKRFLLTCALFSVFNNLVFADTLRFIHVTDVHYPKENIKGYEGRNFEFAKENLENAISKINNSNADYVFFTGDSVDQAHKKVFEEFFSTIEKLNKPYFLVLGNHDVNTPNGFTKSDTLTYLKNKTPYKHSDANYAIKLNKDFIAVILDGTNDTKIDSRGHFKKSTIKWFEDVITTNPDKKILVFQHFPLVEPCKDDSYFHKHTTKHKRAYIKLLKKYPNIVLVSSGHYHIAGVFEKYGCKHFSTPALFLEDSFYRTVQIDYSNGEINKIGTSLIKP